MKIFVKNMKLKSTSEYEVDDGDTVESLLTKVRSQSGTQDDNNEYTLAYKAKKLSPDTTFSSAGVPGDSTLVLMVKINKKSTTTSSTSSSASSKPSTPSAPAEPPKKCLDPSCSFFGSKDNDGYCSVCYKKNFGDKKKPEQKKQEAPETPTESGTTSTSDSNAPLQPDTTKCWKCNRNVGLLGFNCQCKYVFCAKHRYGDKHNCTFDYKAREQSKLDKDLQKVVGGKLNPIS